MRLIDENILGQTLAVLENGAHAGYSFKQIAMLIQALRTLPEEEKEDGKSD